MVTECHVVVFVAIGTHARHKSAHRALLGPFVTTQLCSAVRSRIFLTFLIHDVFRAMSSSLLHVIGNPLVLSEACSWFGLGPYMSTDRTAKSKRTKHEQALKNISVRDS